MDAGEHVLCPGHVQCSVWVESRPVMLTVSIGSCQGLLGAVGQTTLLGAFRGVRPHKSMRHVEPVPAVRVLGLRHPGLWLHTLPWAGRRGLPSGS